MRLLISGGAGFVGSYLCRKLLEYGHDVDILDIGRLYVSENTDSFIRNQQYKSMLRDGVQNHFNFSTLDTANLLSILNKGKYDSVVHLAANPLATVAMVNPTDAFTEIAAGTNSICDAIRLSDVANSVKFTLISSSMAYGDFKGASANEKDICDPKDVYGSLKLISEIVVKAYTKNFGLKSSIIRPSAVYGAGDNNRRVIQNLVENAVIGKQLKIVDPQETYLDFTHVTELANAIALISTMETPAGEVYNATRGHARSLAEVAQIIKKLVPNAEIVSVENKENFRPKRGTLDNTKIFEHVGAEFKIDIEHGLEQYIGYLRGEN